MSESSKLFNILIDLKIMLDNLESATVNKDYKRKVKFHGNALIKELDHLWEMWINSMPDKNVEKSYFDVCKTKELFNSILNELCSDADKMDTLRCLLNEFKDGKIMQIDEQTGNMIEMIKPGVLKPV